MGKADFLKMLMFACLHCLAPRARNRTTPPLRPPSPVIHRVQHCSAREGEGRGGRGGGGWSGGKAVRVMVRVVTMGPTYPVTGYHADILDRLLVRSLNFFVGWVEAVEGAGEKGERGLIYERVCSCTGLLNR